MEFWRLFRVVLAGRRLILGLMAITLLTVFLFKSVLEQKKQFSAAASVYPSPVAMNPGGLYASSRTGMTSPAYDRPTRLALFVQSIKSHVGDALEDAAKPSIDQKREVVRALGPQLPRPTRQLILSDQASESEMDAILRLFHVPTDPAVWAPHAIPPDQQEQIQRDFETGPEYANEVNLSPGGATATPTMTDRLQITVHAPDAALARKLAILTAAAFINAYQDEGTQEYQQSFRRLYDNQHEAALTVKRTQNRLIEFEKKTGIFNPQLQTSEVMTTLADNKRQRDSAQVALNNARAAIASYDLLLRSTPPQVTTSLDPRTRPEAQKLEEQIAEARVRQQTLAARLTPENPEYQHAAAEAAALQTQYDALLHRPFIQARENLQYSALKAKRDEAVQQAASAQATVSTLSGQIQRQQAENSNLLADAQKTRAALEGDLETARSNKRAADLAYHNLLLTGKAMDPGLITLTNTPSYATAESTGPSLPALLIYAAILSLIVGIGLVLGADYLDNTVQTVPDVEKLMGLPVSGVIPEMPPGPPQTMMRLTLADPLSPIAEAYRILRTDLLFTADHKPFQSLMAATAKPGQGATTTLCNLAVALAQVGKRVILIDADLRRPKLHEIFQVSNETGLTSLLRGECEIEEALKVTEIDNLLILPSGPLPLNPSELLASQRMRVLHERLKPHTEFVLIDSPSAVAFSDAAILSSFVDAVLLVVRAQEAPRGSEIQVKNMLNKARANVIGLVLNGVKPQLVDSYHYHAAYYPQVSVYPPDRAGHGGALPAPHTNGLDTGSNGIEGNGFERTLMGDALPPPTEEAAGEDNAGNGSSHDRTIMMEPFVQAGQPKARSRFNLRALFGGDDEEPS